MAWKKRSWTCFVAALVSSPLLTLSPLQAAEPPLRPYPKCDPSTADATSAKSAFRAGRIAFEEADYENAVALWETAYERDCTAHVLLKNLARVHELRELYRHAIHALITYNARISDVDERAQVKRRIATLEQRLDQRRQSSGGNGTSEGTPAQPATGQAPNNTHAIDNSAEPGESAAVGTGQSDVGEDRATPDRPVWPLYVAGGGALLAAGAAVPYVLGLREAARIETECGGDRNTCTPLQSSQGENARDDVTLWGTVTWVGLGAAIGGAALYFLSPSEEPVAWTPVIAPGFAGAVYTGSF